MKTTVAECANCSRDYDLACPKRRDRVVCSDHCFGAQGFYTNTGPGGSLEWVDMSEEAIRAVRAEAEAAACEERTRNARRDNRVASVLSQWGYRL